MNTSEINTYLKMKVAGALLLGSSIAFAAASEEAVEIAHSFERFDESDAYFGFLQDNCMDCHNFEDWAGSI